MAQPKQYTPEEMAELEKSRTISDAELLKGGAEYEVDENGGKKLRVTKEQEIGLDAEHRGELERKKFQERNAFFSDKEKAARRQLIEICNEEALIPNHTGLKIELIEDKWLSGTTIGDYLKSGAISRKDLEKRVDYDGEDLRNVFSQRDREQYILSTLEELRSVKVKTKSGQKFEIPLEYIEDIRHVRNFSPF